MAKKQINQSYSSFSRNTETNRANEVRRDNDVVKTPKCTIEDVDWTIMSYIQKIINQPLGLPLPQGQILICTIRS